MLKAVLVGASLKKDELMEYYLEELESLAKASNIEVVYKITQTMHKITPNLYIGSGKVDEIKTFVDNLDADMVIFNNELSGSQVRNLESILECRVIDRTLLILDIFASRAKTKEAMLQVEIAQLEYMLPRLVGLRESLNRQQGGIGSKGPGEKKLELDRRRIVNEKAKLTLELKDVVKSRKIQRRIRDKSSIKKVAIVGYTNAGKSTLLNKLISHDSPQENKEVLSKDMLFATLETSTRHIRLQNKKEFIITDTVGFVSNLPHNLVESFKSTLEEITEADLLLHVVDSSNPHYETQIDVTDKTLKEIGVHDIPTIYLYNKIDLVTTQLVPSHYPHLTTSLQEEEHILNILEVIEKELFSDYETLKLLIPFSQGDLIHYFNENSNVLSQEYTNDGTIIELELSQIQKGRYSKYIL